MSFQDYCTEQIKAIKALGRHLGVSDDKAAQEWIKRGCAARWAARYRKEVTKPQTQRTQGHD